MILRRAVPESNWLVLDEVIECIRACRVLLKAGLNPEQAIGVSRSLDNYVKTYFALVPGDVEHTRKLMNVITEP